MKEADRLFLELESSTAIRLRWGARDINLQRQHHSAFNPRTDYWIEDNDAPAVALAVECLPDSVFAALLTAHGWCITVAAARDNATYVGDWLRFRGGQTREGPWQKPEAETVGKAHIAWVDADCVVIRQPSGRRVALARYARIPQE